MEEATAMGSEEATQAPQAQSASFGGGRREDGRLTFFYCGRGDTILLHAAPNHWAIVDCNLTESSGAYWRVREHLDRFGIDWLDFVCLSHPDFDHYNGMRELLEERFLTSEEREPRFGEFWHSGADLETFVAISDSPDGPGISPELEKLSDFLFDLWPPDSLQRVQMTRDRLSEIEFGGFQILSLAPLQNRVDRFNRWRIDPVLKRKDERNLKFVREQSNDLSCILVLMHKSSGTNILLGGDASGASWSEALGAWDKLCVAVKQKREIAGVKVSHHGALGSHHAPLYDNYCDSGQTIAILSVGNYNGKHPDPLVLDALRQRSIAAYATCWPWPIDRLGAPATRTAYAPPPAPRRTKEPRPTIPGHKWADIEVTVWSDGSLSVTPRDALLPL